MPNYVSIRLKPITARKAADQTAHDWRFCPPSYIVQAHTVIHSWTNDDEPPKSRTVQAEADALRANSREQRAWIRDKVIMPRSTAQEARAKTLTGQRCRKDANMYISGVITFSPDGVAGVDPAELHRRADDLIRRIAAEYHVRPIYTALHTDETTPHVHWMLENIRMDTGRSAARAIHQAECRRLQDWAGAAYAELGLVRGVSRDVTGARHLSVRASHRAEQAKLAADTSAARTTAAEARADAEDELDRAAQAQERAQAAQAAAARAERRAAELEADLERLTAEQRRRRRTLDELRRMERDERDAYNRQTRERRARIKALKEQLRRHGAPDDGDPVKAAMADELAAMTAYIAQRGMAADYEDWAADYRAAAKAEAAQDDETGQDYTWLDMGL